MLIAAALGVKAEVFREAFGGVTPARGGEGPTGEQARTNKQALLKVLSPHGVTNERLDEVSNFYRFNPGAGETWRQTPAEAVAIIKDGRVTGFRIVSPGAAYTPPPKVVVPGFPNVRAEATVEYTKDLKTNGRLSSITLLP